MGGKESTEEGEGGGKWSRRSAAGSGGGMSDHETEASDEKTKRSQRQWEEGVRERNCGKKGATRRRAAGFSL